ncbi:MAG TPA: SMR family transporter [Agitococcus sp.]|nr:SMR family transporter [Agitococcus sp.]HNC85820.1 SMR family transporter [Agitococcus sp.]HNE90817.1 SMR family transporter [Agitococcus sp.]HNI62232.1 SMR family transporter [Agitococcus sp.]
MALTVFFNVFGTFLARLHSQQEKIWLLAFALASYTAAFVTWSKVLKYFDMGFASSVTTGTVLTLSNLIAFFWLNEVYSASKLFFTSLIVVGVIGVNLSHT